MNNYELNKKEDEIEGILDLPCLSIAQKELIRKVYNHHPLFVKAKSKQDRQQLLKSLYELGGVNLFSEMELSANRVFILRKDIIHLQEQITSKEDELQQYIDKWNSFSTNNEKKENDK